ncbi:hypothetical protein K470DRAFT_140969 [Piedraia hortae CBS 480.64]|uniref:Extracellular membrane protein CFEM domain-containing protein n=1 Tax=Piedraia hortae CBS 480.64 TaxID=1314780 RepID=A0A6A7C6S4_9PEZI|nr:hypothetical protein K470DRAFT_140969 [Piedraia hortae CBS 480.64]
MAPFLQILLALPFAAAVSLSDFPPRLSNLPPACQSIYKADIGACSASDFAGSGCSVGCIRALNDLTAPIKRDCGNHGIQGENIVVAFLDDEGPVSVCSNAKSVLASMGTASSTAGGASQYSSAETSTGSGDGSAASKPTGSSTLASPSTSPASSVDATTTKSTTQSGIVHDTSKATSATKTKGSSTPNNGGGGGGGGSPFDSQYNGNGATATAPLALAIALAVMTLWGTA